MLFHSTAFLLFLAAFLLLFWLVRSSLRARNLLVVAGSYFFYGWWDWRFLGLLLASSLIDYFVGLALARTPLPAARRRWLLLSLVANLGTLGFFKYFGFFLGSFHDLLRGLGVDQPSWTWNVILPVGISFYTFQTLSYTIDVYRRQLEPTRDLAAFLAYVSFFPQLVAGPIERASHLLPQFLLPRVIRLEDVQLGIWWILCGLFKKVVIADHLAAFAELALDRAPASAPVLALGVLAFAGQIYGDFSGYSDVARGLARLLGFDLRLNFALPYAATSVREFWHCWHISLSTWLRDYLYLPLGGSRVGHGRTQVNLLITMILGGLWHGASWNFVLWGAWHGVALVIHRAWLERQRRLPALLGWFLTVLTVAYGWLLFRGGSLTHLAELHQGLAILTPPPWIAEFAWGVFAWWLPLFALDAWQSWRRDPTLPPPRSAVGRALVQGGFLLALAAYWEREAAPFLYFQF